MYPLRPSPTNENKNNQIVFNVLCCSCCGILHNLAPKWLQYAVGEPNMAPRWPTKKHTATLPLSHCHYHTATLPLSHCHMSKPQHNYHRHYHTATTVLSTPTPHHHHHHHPYSHHCQSPHHSMLSANTTYTQHMHHLWAMSEPSCTSPFTHSLKHSHATTSGKCSARGV